MSGVRVLRTSKVFLCVAASAIVGACGAAAGAEPEGALTGGAPDGTSTVNAAVCTTAQAGTGWRNQGFVAQPGALSVEFTATPSASPIDAVVGLGDGPAAGFAALAAIVRFNPAGAIDVRAGGAYQADASVPYTAGTAYRFHLDLDVAAHSYSVSVEDPFGNPIWLARGYPFRSEQAQVGQLGDLAVEVDSSAGGLEVCGLHITPIDAAGCPVVEAGLGFFDRSIGQPGEVVVSSDFTVQPDRILDGVIGLSRSGAASFDDFAATVRLAPSGAIDARDGGGYRADATVAYAAGQPRRIRIVAVVPTHTFSVYVATRDGDSRQLARRYAFRTTQAAAAWLGNLGAVVDSAGGAMSLCNAGTTISVGVRLAREGNYAVAPLPAGDESIVSDGATTLHLGASGGTRAQVAAGGQVAADPAGNVYLARITGSDLVVEAYTTDLVLRWSRSYPAGADHRVLAIGADGASVVAATGPTAGGVDLVKRWLTDGTESTTAAGPMGDAVAISAAGYVIGSAINGNVVVTKWSFGHGTPDWQRAWQNTAHIDAMALAPSGAVAFAGRFSGTASFGGPTIAPASPGDVYVAALSATGDPAFARALPDVAVRGLASNGQVIAVSLLRSERVPELVNLDTQGLVIRGDEGETGFGVAGDAGAVAVGPSGRVYWNFADAWPNGASPAYPYLISLVPGV